MSTADDQPPAEQRRAGVTRREIVSGAVMFGAGAGLGHVLSGGSSGTPAEPSTTPAPAATPAASMQQLEPFYGARQSGVTTLAQEYLSFAAFDVTSEAVEDLRSLLERWTDAAAVMAAGRPYEPARGQADEPPIDPGEAIGLPPARLTITFGFGPSLFGSGGVDRFGLAASRPAALRALPRFQGESIDPAISGGDLCVQACANDPQVAFHAGHLLAKLAVGTARLRWSQFGFGRTASTSRVQVTTRNLMGFKDGTNNIRAEEAGAVERFVWVQPGDGPAWMTGGTYLVARRIRILLDGWDTSSLRDQERTIGRDKLTGAPLGRAREYDRVDLEVKDAGGAPAIPLDAHVRLANPANNGGMRILRRGYSFAEPAAGGGEDVDAGLFFISFQRDPERQFLPLQSRLAALDALNRHTRPVSSSIFACPPGAREGGFIGEALLAKSS